MFRTFPPKRSDFCTAACLLFLHLRARTSPVTFRGMRAYYSCTCVPGQARSHLEGCVPIIPAPACLDKPGHIQRAACLLFLHLRARPGQARSHAEGYVPEKSFPYVPDQQVNTYCRGLRAWKSLLVCRKPSQHVEGLRAH